MPFKLKFALVANLAILLCGTSPLLAEDDAPEMWQEPSHQLVFERGSTRILDIRVVPGTVSEYHSHRLATAYVVIEDAGIRSQRTGADWFDLSDRDYKPAGALMDRADYLTKPYVHRVENVDDRSLHLIAVVNGGDFEPDPKLEMTAAGALLDNPYFSEHRIVVDAGKQSESLSFDNESVVVQAHRGPSRIIETGVEYSYGTAPGAWSWHRPDVSYRIANDSDERREFVVLEIRRP